MINYGCPVYIMKFLDITYGPHASCVNEHSGFQIHSQAEGKETLFYNKVITYQCSLLSFSLGKLLTPLLTSPQCW
jgi:hypothetical protein